MAQKYLTGFDLKPWMWSGVEWIWMPIVDCRLWTDGD